MITTGRRAGRPDEAGIFAAVVGIAALFIGVFSIWRGLNSSTIFNIIMGLLLVLAFAP